MESHGRNGPRENTRAEERGNRKVKNCPDREQYGKEIKVLVENKEKRKGTAWSKERKQSHAEMMRRYRDER